MRVNTAERAQGNLTFFRIVELCKQMIASVIVDRTSLAGFQSRVTFFLSQSVVNVGS